MKVDSRPSSPLLSAKFTALSKCKAFCLNNIFFRLGVKVNALIYTGYGLSAIVGVIFNNTLVPSLGWNAMFITLGCFSLLSLVLLLFFFKIEKSTFIPYEDERSFFTKDVNANEKSREKKKHRKSSRDKKTRTKKEGIEKPLLFVSDPAK